MSAREGSFLSLSSTGFHRIVYSDWGPQDGPLALCVHGLTRNGHDFHTLAEDLAAHGYRVVAVDMPGRARSDFLINSTDYNYTKYVNDLTALLAHLGVTEPQSIDWIGTSMGGVLGMIMAAQPNTPIRRLVINDVGPFIEKDALDYIARYISNPPVFNNLQDFEKDLRQRYQPWGILSDEQWHIMAEDSVRALPDGRLTYAYDPAIADVFAASVQADVDLWPVWELVNCPVLLLRGIDSPVLTQVTANRMAEKKRVHLQVIDGCGHAPSLAVSEQISLIRDWLLL